MTWLEDYLEATKFAETPRSFFYWSGLATISAVVKNRVWIEKDIYKLYPNIYVLLIARSGLRKGFPVALSKQLVEAVNDTKIIAGRASIQAIIQELARAKKTDHGYITESSGYINAGEFASSLVHDPDALTILTDLYDGHYNKEWKNVLKSTGIETLKSVNLTILGALNQPHFEDMMTEKEIFGGFIARCMTIVEEKRALKNSLLRSKSNLNIEALALYLKELSKLEGRIEVEEEAIVTFEEWYNRFEPENLEDKTGTANRVHDHILKTAMLISLSRTLELKVNKEDMEEAMTVCLTASSAVRKVTAGKGKSELAAKTKLIIEDLVMKEDHMLSRQWLLNKYSFDIEVRELDMIIEKLEQADALRTKRDGKNWYYTLTDKFLLQYQKFLERGN